MPPFTRLAHFHSIVKHFPIHGSTHTFRYFSSGIKKKLSEQQIQVINKPEIVTLQEAFSKHHQQIRIVGGAVRDLLLEKTPTNFDIVTTASFDEMKSILLKENIRILNVSQKSNVILVRVNDNLNFPIKSFQKMDKGHYDWDIDANHRDFTINSMFLDLAGNIYDFTNGLQDLEKKKIVFVGNPAERIVEDPIRILRYFRFFGHFSQEDTHDALVLDILRSHCHLLGNVSGQPLWKEFKKILHGSHVIDLIKKIMNLGIGKFCGFPDEPNITEFEQVWKRSIKLNPELMTVVSSFLHNLDDVKVLDKRVILSGGEIALAKLIVSHRSVQCLDNLKPFQDLVIETPGDVSTAKELVGEVLKYNGNEKLYIDLMQWDIPEFPITFEVLSNYGIKSPKMTKKFHLELKKYWKQCNFTADKVELLNYLDLIRGSNHQ